MSKELLRELALLEKKENKLLHRPFHPNRVKEAMYQKVPTGLQNTLQKAFEKAFSLVFLKGTRVIEKTFDKETASLNYEAGNYVVDRVSSRKSVRRLDQTAKKDKFVNHAVTTVSGFGMGLFGLGLPDIPLLTGTLLKGIYEIALGYGFDYHSIEEQVYILRLIRTALSEGEERLICNSQLDQMEPSHVLEQEVTLTAKVLSDALLVEKFVQGIPIVGVVGGFVNHAVYAKTSALAAIKYKKRYLVGKIYGSQNTK